MRFVALDYESFFSDDFTLSKLTTEEYIRSPQFKAHGAAIKWGPDHAARWYNEDQLRQVLASENWSDVFLIHHHAQFDGLICNHHYKVVPKMWGCTLAMARFHLGNHISASLESVRGVFGFPPKITPYNVFKNKQWHELTQREQEMVAEGACDEVESIWKLFGILAKGFPGEEYTIIDQTIRMFTQPVLRANVSMLENIWLHEEHSKAARYAALGVDKKVLGSNEQFANLLRDEGVEPETKEGKNGPIYAFAKTDEFMRGLLEDEDDRVRALAEGRLGLKSNAVQTRAETLGFMARRGPLCVYLHIYGAHTKRWSGGDRANWQNFKRSDSAAPGTTLREAIEPPEGFHVLDPDLSQIEARILCHLAGQWDVLEDFRNGVDIYCKMATAAYGYEVTKAMKAERGTGKQLRLSCGFQAGDKTIQRTARLGLYGPPVYIDLETAKYWKEVFREENPEIVKYWKVGGRMLSRIAGGPPLQWGPFEIKNKRVYLPNGCFVNYESLEFDKEEDTWRLKTRKGWTRMYSGRLIENLVQFAARCVASQAFVRIVGHGYRILNTEHDKHWVLIPQDGREMEHINTICGEMVRVPDWLPDIPLNCEVHFGGKEHKF